MKTILALGSHFDDVEMGCGGTLVKHATNGDRVLIAITNSDDNLAGDIAIRREEQISACFLYGATFSLYKSSDPEHYIIKELDCLSPDILFIHFDKDTHQHHVRASRIGMSVGRKKNISAFFYDGGSSYDFHPNVFSIISMKKKLELVNCFKSQIDRGTIKINLMKKKEAYWGSLISNEDVYAEGFIGSKLMYAT
uniref:Putative N-acetylglucosaminylphosphatidylinositol de-N-acetylase n=1 Tax=viral metagenome TaxID=1070528 RepID=A0A6M3IZG7_9ZZZZ